MKPLLTGLLATLTLVVCFLPSHGQAVFNRDSAQYYFERGASFYEDHRGLIPQALTDSSRRRAMRLYSRAIAFDSSYYWAYRNRGYCHENFGEYEQALADYNRAVQAGLQRGEADAAFVQYDCIHLCLILQKWAEAEAHCSALLANEAICSAPVEASCSRVWRDRADARVGLKKYAEARHDYLLYQQQVAQEVAEEQQKLFALAQAQEQAPPLTNRQRRQNWRWERRWTQHRMAVAGGRSREKEVTTLEQLQEEARVVALKLAHLEAVTK